MTKKIGRPPTDKTKRDRQVSCYLTPDDSDWLNDFAEGYGFKSRSELITAVLERLILCGFSGVGSLRMALQMQDRCQAANPARYSQTGLDFASVSRPLPHLPDVAIEPEDAASVLADLTEEFRNERKPA